MIYAAPHSPTMKTSVIAASALAVLLVVGVAAVALASNGQAAAAQTTKPINANRLPGDKGDDRVGPRDACRAFTPGESLTLSGLRGRYFNATSPSATANVKGLGNASGTFDLLVGQTYLGGCTLTITGGSFSLGPSTYAVTGGSLVFGPRGHLGVGSGTASSGTFLIRIAGLHGNSTSASAGAVKLDFKAGSNEYLVFLGSPASSG
jgi:hypothetical protein